MSDTDTQQDAEFPVDEETPPEIEVEPKKKSGFGLKAIGAVIVVLLIAALGIFGYQKFEEWRNVDSAEAVVAVDHSDELAALQRELAAANASISALEAAIDGLPDNDNSADLDGLRRDVDQQLDVFKTLPPRLSTLENSVASLAGISEGARETFLLSEAEYYMQIANAQLQLANNPQLAVLALRMADERVTQLADPGLTDVRRALSNEIAALDVMEKPDLEGATLTLASLARVVETLPLTDPRQTEAQEETAEEQGNLEAAWSSVKGAMSGLVKVTPPEQARLAVLSPDAAAFLRNNIALQLQAARLALLRGELAIFQQSLDDSSALLTSYFDTDSESVNSTLATLADIRSGVFTAENPDISNSLRLLRQYRSLNEIAE